MEYKTRPFPKRPTTKHQISKWFGCTFVSQRNRIIPIATNKFKSRDVLAKTINYFELLRLGISKLMSSLVRTRCKQQKIDYLLLLLATTCDYTHVLWCSAEQIYLFNRHR